MAHVRWLPQRLNQLRPLIDFRQHLDLHALLHLLHQEEPDRLRDGVPHRPNHQREISIDSGPNFMHEYLRRVYLLRRWRRLPIFILESRDQIGAVLDIIEIVGKEIPALALDNALDHLPGLLTLPHHDHAHNLHDLIDKRRESLEHPASNRGSQSFQISISIHNARDSRVLDPVKLGADERHEHVGGREARDRVTLVVYDHALDISVGVLFGDAVVADVLFEEVVEEELDFGAAGQLALDLGASVWVVFAPNRVAEGGAELGDHLPEELDFLVLVDRHGWA